MPWYEWLDAGHKVLLVEASAKLFNALMLLLISMSRRCNAPSHRAVDELVRRAYEYNVGRVAKTRLCQPRPKFSLVEPLAAAGSYCRSSSSIWYFRQQSTLYVPQLLSLRPACLASYAASSAIYGESSARRILFSYTAPKPTRLAELTEASQR